MSSYYENQLKAYIDKVGEAEKIIAGLKERLYKSLRENDEIRKNFEIEISKQRARVQDLKIKLASIQLEHKEHVSTLGSKVQLTSQTLIRETEHKEKTKGQYEEEKKKYHYLANSKDKEIGDLMVMMGNMKRMHEDELKLQRTEKIQVKTELDDTREEIKRIKADFEEQLKQKDDKMKDFTTSNEKEIQEIKDLEDKIEVLEKNNVKLKKQYEHLQLVNASIAQ
jgi:DNA repair exonuclease SbcCD ATPase subunit